MTKALAIFTGKATPEILREGGTRSWVLDQRKARSYKYAVLYFNERAPYSTKGYTEHGAAFLVGRISDVVPSSEDPGRHIVLFDAYAEISGAGAWAGWRNPIRYSTLEDLSIVEASLNFLPMPQVADSGAEEVTAAAEATAPSEFTPLTIEAAKERLAQTFGVSPANVKITIEG